RQATETQSLSKPVLATDSSLALEASSGESWLASGPSRKEGSSRTVRPSTSQLSVANQADPVLAQLLGSMVQAWETGYQLHAELRLKDDPDLRDQPDRGLELVYEEICQRQQAGLPVDRVQFTSRFPRWARQIQLLFDCHQVLGEPSLLPVYPGPGEQVGEFQL